jgi:hypothetical protein
VLIAGVTTGVSTFINALAATPSPSCASAAAIGIFQLLSSAWWCRRRSACCRCS